MDYYQNDSQVLDSEEDYLDESKEIFKSLIKGMSFVSEMKKHTKLIGRKEELQLLEESLYKKRMKNSVIVGSAGVGKTAIVEELAHRIKDKYYVVRMDIPCVVAGTKYRGEFEEKLTSALNKISKFNAKSKKPIIIFIDEIHTLARAGGAEGAIDAGNIVKPFLSSGEITIIGATTLKEYNECIKKDNALSRRLPAIYIKSLNDEETLEVLKSFCDGEINEEGLKYIYEKSRNIPNSQNPDISIEILDRCMARSKCRNEDVSNKMIDEIIEYFLR